MTLDLRLDWRPVTRGGRTLMLTCWRCRRGHVNESNSLRREGWQEARWGRGFVFRCAACADATTTQDEP